LKRINPSTIFIILSVILLLSYIFIKFNSQRTKLTEITINDKKIQVEIADTEVKREKGLSFHKPLASDEGMVFVFESPANYGFWMKDMTFDLDFIWIKNSKIVEITENVSHNDQRKVYQPKLPVDQVLEVKAGFAKENDIRIGSGVLIKN